jgi:hypothetical protein
MLHRGRVGYAVERAACRDGWDLTAAKIETGPERDVG